MKYRFKNTNMYFILLTIVVIVAMVFIFLFSYVVKNQKDENKSNANKKIISNLTQEEKLEDFNYLYEVIEKNYPFLEVNKRVNNADWKANKDIYLQRVKDTENNTDFYMVLEGILRDLNNGHTSMYKANADKVKSLLKRKVELEKSDYKYNWQEKNTINIIQNKTFLERNNINLSEDEVKSKEKQVLNQGNNIICKDIIENEFGYVRIKSFDDNYIQTDRDSIDKYLDKVKDFKGLIIDIRGNRGGTDLYWKKVLFPRIINKTYSSTKYLFYRDGDLEDDYLKYTYGDDLKGVNTVTNDLISKCPSITKEILKDFKYYITDEDKIIPKDPISYKGKIYLLVDKEVYSASESLAVFCKQSKLATLVGEKTGGGDNGIGPATIMLPKSGLLFKFDIALGAHFDGSSDEEFKVEPDVYIKDPRISEDLPSDNCIKEILALEK
ncbi:peptidase [Clostridium zeae]|uniref:Peptidase n=1 Tax=Clostridium zeae TaxID=2759022 RepID=A0ABQ1EGJ7_9CLOT|nr:S41 family peptidase [Clostridium zeae]GFZ33852.1 peptidase [Clostridium zeae]